MIGLVRLAAVRVDDLLDLGLERPRSSGPSPRPAWAFWIAALTVIRQVVEPLVDLLEVGVDLLLGGVVVLGADAGRSSPQLLVLRRARRWRPSWPWSVVLVPTRVWASAARVGRVEEVRRDGQDDRERR